MNHTIPLVRSIRKQLFDAVERRVTYPVWSKVVGNVSSRISNRIAEDIIISELQALTAITPCGNL